MCASKFIKVSFALYTENVHKHWVTDSTDHVRTELSYPSQMCATIPEHLKLEIREK